MSIIVNYWAVLVAAVVNFVVGWIWYGPLFGDVWKKLMGLSDQSMKSMKLTPMQAMSMGFVVALVMAYVLAHYASIVGITTIGGAFQLSFWTWLGFMATVSIGSYLWEGRPFKLFVLNAAEQLVALFLMAVVLVLWQ